MTAPPPPAAGDASGGPSRLYWRSLYLAAWVPVAVLVTALLVIATPLGPPAALAFGLPLLAVLAQLGVTAGYVCRANPLYRGDRGVSRSEALRAAAAVTGAAVAIGGLWLVAGRVWSGLLGRFDAFAGLPALFPRLVPLLFAVGVLLYLLAAAGFYLAQALEASQRAERRALEARALAREAELKALRAQIDPHFLFNSLNAVAALAGSDPPAARRMALLLADFLRRTLRLAPRTSVPLAEELALVGAYLEIERVRLGDRLRLRQTVAAGLDGLAVPPLVLQPLVENAIKHGVARCLDGGEVDLDVTAAGGRLRLTVINDRDPEAAVALPGVGLGLDNLRRRLAATYGRDARLSAAAEGPRYRVEVELPAERDAAGVG